MAELEDEDDFPNDFDGLDFDNIPGLQAPSATGRHTQLEVFVPRLVSHQNITPSTVASPVPSTESNSTEDMDPVFLAAVDALEARALSELSQGTTNASKTTLDSHQGGYTNGQNRVHEYHVQSTELALDKKGKRKAVEDVDVRAMLAGYETDLTCPICCDLLVGAQVANPCGHTCCGVCSYAWLAQNKYEPACAICRSSLCTLNPLLPNFTVDSIVRQHLQALSRSGRPEWQERGYRTIEWNKRAESWKRQNDARMAKGKVQENARPRRRQPRYYDFDAATYVPPWLIDEHVEDDDRPVYVVPRRSSRR